MLLVYHTTVRFARLFFSFFAAVFRGGSFVGNPYSSAIRVLFGRFRFVDATDPQPSGAVGPRVILISLMPVEKTGTSSYCIMFDDPENGFGTTDVCPCP